LNKKKRKKKETFLRGNLRAGRRPWTAAWCSRARGPARRRCGTRSWARGTGTGSCRGCTTAAVPWLWSVPAAPPPAHTPSVIQWFRCYSFFLLFFFLSKNVFFFLIPARATPDAVLGGIGSGFSFDDWPFNFERKNNNNKKRISFPCKIDISVLGIGITFFYLQSVIDWSSSSWIAFFGQWNIETETDRKSKEEYATLSWSIFSRKNIAI